MTAVINLITKIMEGDIDLSALLQTMFTVLKTVLWADICDFFENLFYNSRDKFIGLGGTISKAVGSVTWETFTDYWYFWLIGACVGIWIFKFIISTVVELISKLIDPM